jgi:hypothetical protein
MTGFEYEFQDGKGDEDQKTILTVHFRPDKHPKDKAQWFEWLGNYAHTTANLLRSGGVE